MAPIIERWSRSRSQIQGGGAVVAGRGDSPYAGDTLPHT
jgi:hypothetical protein